MSNGGTVGTAKWKRLKGLSLRAKMAAGGIVVLLVPVLVIGGVTFLKSSRSSKEAAKTQLVQIAESLSGMLNLSLEKDIAIHRGIASDPLILQSFELNKKNQARERLGEYYRILKMDYEGLAVYDESGTIVIDGADESREGISIADRNYFSEGREGKIGIGSVVYSKATGDPVFGISVPVFSSDNDFLGGVIAIVKVDYLINFVSSIKIGKTGYVYMIGRDGIVIAHPEREIILKNDLFENEELADLAAAVTSSTATAVEYRYNGEEKISGFTTVKRTGWIVGVCQDTGEIMSLADNNIRFIFFVSGFFVVLTILAVFVFSNKVGTPVQATLASLNRAVGQATEAFVILKLDGEIRFLNRAMAGILGSGVEELTGTLLDFSTFGQTKSREIRDSIEGGESWNGLLSEKRDDGAICTIDFTISPVRGKNGDIDYFLGIGKDITKEKRLQEQIQQSQKMEAIGALAGGIAHDFNNVLTAIFGYAELSLNFLDDTRQLEVFLTEIIQASIRAKELVNHILTFSRRVDAEQKPLIPLYVIQDYLKLLRTTIPSAIEIETEFNSSAVIMGDPTQIQQMITNLSTNAWYAMKERGGVIRVKLNEITLDMQAADMLGEIPPGDYLELKIEDTGCGIPVEIRERIFEPFFTSKPTGEGTGLGLSVVHGIVKGLKGAITVSSEMDRGSVFTVYLPIVSAEIEKTEGTVSQELPCGSGSIMLVDDEEAITDTGKQRLERLGYRVSIFNNSPLALEYFVKAPRDYDLIITDYTMPQMSGIELARKIREVRSDIPVIICSGYYTIDEEYENLEPVKFLNKPIRTSDLAHTVYTMITTVKG